MIYYASNWEVVVIPESAQDQHDEMLTSRKPKLLPRAEFEALLK